MSNQKRLSQISLAAIALSVAALPCLAQTESSKNRNVKVQGTEIVTLRNERLGLRKAEPKTVSSENVDAKATIARDKFNESIAQATSATSGFQSSATMTESDWQRTQRVGSQTESTSAKGITFVASRGQRLPD